MSTIHFFSADVDFKLHGPIKIKRWIKLTIHREHKELSNLNIIFCSDEYLKSINLQYLNHDYYTDIITFDYSENIDVLEGEMYISIQRVEDNANKHQVSYSEELNRVMIHGVLHLLGYRDHSKKEQAAIRKKENECLNDLINL